MSDLNKTLADRQKTHGDFQQVAKVAESLMGSIEFQRLSASQSFAVRMIIGKLARIVCGNPNEPDHWHDIAGYAKLVEDELTVASAKQDTVKSDFPCRKFAESLQILKNNLAKKFLKIDIVEGNSIRIISNNDPKTDGDEFTRDVASMWECINTESERLGLECYKQNILPYRKYPIIAFVFRELK